MITTLLYTLFFLDQTLGDLAAKHSALMFSVLFLVIFAETGLIVFPFLPGDAVLFIAGTIAASSVGIDVHLLVLILILAAVLGDTVNYSVGHYIGPKVFARPDSRWIKKKHLVITQEFYEKYGGFTIIIGRWVPIVRTFAPFLAGVAQMSYRQFLSFNIVGGVVWITSLVYAGYLFGNIPWVKRNLTFIVMGIVLISIMPMVIKFWGERRRLKKEAIMAEKSG